MGLIGKEVIFLAYIWRGIYSTSHMGVIMVLVFIPYSSVQSIQSQI